jgi:hypothetical protein
MWIVLAAAQQRRVPQSLTWVVRGAGLEPAQYCYRQDLNLVRLPISPPARFYKQTGGKLSCRLCEIGQPYILPDAGTHPVKRHPEPLEKVA